jgi:4-amino-4-deoxy-L-arabinose transferase-like glycosyltransferase
MRDLTLAAPAFRWRIEGLRVPLWAVALGGMTLLGFALRLIWVLHTDAIPLGGDPHWYYTVGINIASGDGFVAARDEIWEVPGPGEPTAFWPPGYPFALGALFWLFGASVTTAQVLNALIGAMTVPLVFGLGARIFSRGVGLAAAGLFAVFPNVIAGTPVLFAEPLFTLISTATLLALVSSSSKDARWLPYLGVGLLIGLAALTRGQGFVLVPIAATYWLLTSGWRRGARSTAIALLTTIAVIAPWTVRNAVELHAFVPVSTNSSAVLRIGHFDGADGAVRWSDDEIDGFTMLQSIYHTEWEVKGYREYQRLAIEYAFSHPGDEVVLSGKKVYHLYKTDSDVIPWLETLGATPLEPSWLKDTLHNVLDYGYYTMLFAAVGSTLLWARRRDANRLLLLVIIAYWTLFHIVFIGDPRYHQPLYPLFFISLAAGLSIAAPALLRAMAGPRGAAPTRS